jgi:hypothetical protein
VLEVVGQIRTELPTGETVLSCGKGIEEGARAALLVAPGLFRVDASPLEDTLRLVLRNLTSHECIWAAEDEPSVVFTGDVELAQSLTPAAYSFAIDANGREARVLISVTRLPDEGVTQFAAQARIAAT